MFVNTYYIVQVIVIYGSRIKETDVYADKRRCVSLGVYFHAVEVKTNLKHSPQFSNVVLKLKMIILL